MSGGSEAVTASAPPAAPSFFDGVPADALATVLDRLERRSFPAGAVVIAEGDRLNEIYIVQTGTAEVFVGDAHGGERRVGRIRPGTTLGEMSLFTGQPAVGTVRATDDLELLVMNEADFEQLTARHPQIYRNLGAILADRLARTDRLAAREKRGRLCVLVDCGAPPELAYALACSAAWHTRTSTLLVVLADELPDVLQPLAESMPDPAAPRAHVMAAPSLDALRAHSLAALIDELFSRYATILVLANEGEVPKLWTARTVQLNGAVAPDAPPGRTAVVQAWSSTPGAVRPGESVARVPALAPSDVEAMRAGLLPPSTSAGKAIGFVARDLVGLTVGLALGAGSLRGYAHLGVLRALERNRLAPDFVAGTSIGSAVAAIYALGYDANTGADIIDRCAATLLRPGMPTKSLLSSRGLRRGFQQFGGNRRIEDLPVPLALVAADIISREEVVIRRGLIWLGVLASAAIPGVWPAVRIGRHVLVDGGVINPVPVTAAVGMGADVVIAVKLEGVQRPAEVNVEARETQGPTPSTVSVMLRSIELMQSRIATDVTSATTIAVAPDLSVLPAAKLRNFAQGRVYLDSGDEALEAAMPRIAAALPWLRP
jgi:NTE family protein